MLLSGAMLEHAKKRYSSALIHTLTENIFMSDPILEASESGWIAQHRELYRKDPEKGHMWDSTVGGGPGPLPTLLLTTTGRKSGKESVMPLLYGKVDGGYAIIASKGGAPKHPGWYHNIKAQGKVGTQVAADIFQANTRVAAGAERAKIWDQMVAMYPPFADYKTAAGDREIPVVVLEPIR
ncbi:MAG: deazaflavin-dependent oxidoreductase (nitroreductase family) [Gammaproteobacteria bacterium]